MAGSTASATTLGFVAALRAFAEWLVAGAHTRLELVSTELQEEKYRMIQALLWINAIVFAGMMTAAFASLTIVYLLWESARLVVLGALTVGYAGVLLAAVVGFRRYLARQPRPFTATLAELQQDRACIRPKN